MAPSATAATPRWAATPTGRCTRSSWPRWAGGRCRRGCTCARRAPRGRRPPGVGRGQDRVPEEVLRMNPSAMPRLPEQPETLESMQARFRMALSPVVDVDKCATDPAHAYFPSKYRRHVFDSAAGIRLIISRDRLADGEEYVHVSISCTGEAARRFGNADAFLAAACCLWRALSDQGAARPGVPEPEEGGAFLVPAGERLSP